MKTNKGFTLIELVIVIVILGILAATALPRFADISSSAHDSAVDGTRGAIGAAVNLARAQHEIENNDGTIGFGSAANIISFDDQGTIGDWPVAAGGALAAALDLDDCAALFGALLDNGPTAVGTGCATTDDYCATAAGDVCTFTYQPDGATRTITYDNSTGAVN